MIITRLRTLFNGAGSPLYECRNCGTALTKDAEECPDCGATEIATYVF